MEVLTTRRKRFSKERITVETKSIKRDYSNPELGIGPWSNCIYLLFFKQDYPNFSYPKLEKITLGEKERLNFDYFKSDFAEINFHGGITFYEEQLNPEHPDHTLVTIGADYQHLGDEHYMLNDFGAEILNREATKLVEEFVDLHNQR